MAEPSRDHPGFAWIMRHMQELVAEFPEQWVVADHGGYVAASADQETLFALLADRTPSELAVVYMDPNLLRSSPPDPRNLPPMSGAGGGGAVFDPAWERYATQS